MSLQGVKVGDIVRVAGSLAMVEVKAKGRLEVRWLNKAGGTGGTRWVTAREVSEHWAKRGRSAA